MSPFAFVFPGQGSQAVGMLDSWRDHPEVVRTLQEASDALGVDMGQLIHEGPKDLLDLTVNTQPAMLTAGIACYRAWRSETGLEPSAVAGHSLGEYSALVVAGALRFSDALPLVRLRADAMQACVPEGEGAMAAVLGLEAAEVSRICAEVARSCAMVVEAVNFNDPKQTVIAGAAAGVHRAGEALKAAGAKRVMPLAVSAPFHSSLMKPAAQRLHAALAGITIQRPRIPVVNNIDVTVEYDADAIRDALVRQAYGPVRWVEVVRVLHAMGMDRIYECGPGKALAGMVRRIDGQIETATINGPAAVVEIEAMFSTEEG